MKDKRQTDEKMKKLFADFTVKTDFYSSKQFFIMVKEYQSLESISE